MGTTSTGASTPIRKGPPACWDSTILAGGRNLYSSAQSKTAFLRSPSTGTASRRVRRSFPQPSSNQTPQASAPSRYSPNRPPVSHSWDSSPSSTEIRRPLTQGAGSRIYGPHRGGTTRRTRSTNQMVYRHLGDNLSPKIRWTTNKKNAATLTCALCRSTVQRSTLTPPFRPGGGAARPAPPG